MKKTLNINLSGLAFTIDEDAYQLLKEYLDTLRRYFRNSDGSDEIMDDIEARVAELMQEKLNETKTVINKIDIEEITAQMGNPEDYVDDESFTDDSYYSSHQKNRFKKLYRDEDNAIIGGVAAGIGHYFGLQPLWIRLALVAAFVFWGTGILLYIVLWIVIPKARTTAEKLEMTGEPVNVSNIGKKVEDELNNVNRKIREDGTFQSAGNSVGAFLERLGGFILRILELFIRALGKIIGVVMLFIGAMLTFVLGIAFIAMISGSVVTLGNISGYSYGELSPLLFANSWDAYLLLIGAFLVAIIPVLAILYGGVSLVSSYRNIPKGLGWGLAGSWALGIVLLLYGSIHTGNQFAQGAEVKTAHTLDFEGDTLFLTLNEASIKDLEGPKVLSENRVDFHFDQQSGVISLGNIYLDVAKSKNETFSLSQTNMARGRSYATAEKNANGIMYQFSEHENTVSFNPFYSFQSVDKWRKQEVDLRLNIPVGKTIYLESNLEDLIYDIQNVTDTYDDDMLGHYWTMTEEGLRSPDFTENEEDDKTSSSVDINIDQAHVEVDL